MEAGPGGSSYPVTWPEPGAEMETTQVLWRFAAPLDADSHEDFVATAEAWFTLASDNAFTAKAWPRYLGWLAREADPLAVYIELDIPGLGDEREGLFAPLLRAVGNYARRKQIEIVSCTVFAELDGPRFPSEMWR